RAVQLPDVLEAPKRVQLRQCGHRRALPRTVVRNRYPRLQRLEHRRKVGIVVGVVRDEVDVNRADEIGRADEIADSVANQVPDIEEAERPVPDADADRPWVLATQLPADLHTLAGWVRLPAAVERMR